MFKNHVVVRTMAVKCGWFSACAVDNGSISLAMEIVIRRGPASDLDCQIPRLPHSLFVHYAKYLPLVLSTVCSHRC